MFRGANGAIRFPKVYSRPENGGIKMAVEYIERIKSEGNHITALLSYSDLIQLGGYAAVEYTGGPSMIFRMGRKDLPEADVHPEGLLPLPTDSPQTVLQKMLRCGFTKREVVAINGSHTLGFMRLNANRIERWTQNPHVFDNDYYKELLLGPKSKFIKLNSEEMLMADPEMKEIVEEYAQDQNLFFHDYAKAHVKMSEFGQEENLLSEFDNATQERGGYLETA